MQLLVDGRAHLVEFLLVAFLQLLHTRVHCDPDSFERLRVGVTELLELLAHCVELHALHIAECAQVRRESGVPGVQGERELLTRLAGCAGSLLACGTKFGGEIRLAALLGRRADQHECKQDGVGQAEDEQYPDENVVHGRVSTRISCCR